MSRHGLGVATRPGYGKGKGGVVTRPGERGRQACVQRTTTRCPARNDTPTCAHDLGAMRVTQRNSEHHACDNALDPVLGLGHCFGSLFMDTIHSFKKKKDPQVLGRHTLSKIKIH